MRAFIDTSKITDWESFHDVFDQVFGFPEFYGRNMDAWIDCMASLDEPLDNLTKIHAASGGVVVIELSDATDLARRLPEIYEAIVECSAFVNYRKLEAGGPAVIALSFWKENI